MSDSDLSRSIIIDCHCHTFNANDLPLKGFLKKVALNADENIAANIVVPLANLLVKIAKNAPDFRKEKNKLDSLLAPGEFGTASMEIGDESDSFENDEAFGEEMRRLMYDLENSEDADERELFAILEEEMGVPPGEVGAAGFGDIAKFLWNAPGAVSRYVKWIKLLTRYRYKVTKKIIDTYCSVDFFTPALIDYDRWVNDNTETSLPEQIELMQRNIRYHKGKVHAYFPFDPWRESEAPGGEEGSLYWLKEAIEKHGFIGAKLYPPMGFSALGNENHTTFPDNSPKPNQEFGRALDTAMRSLFEYCQTNDVPILTHCNDSNETEDTFGERANPDFWEQAVSGDEFPNLRVCLGHFGGLKSLENKPNGWAWKVGRLCNDPDKNVYADISHFGAILDKDERGKAMENLEKLFNDYPNVLDRIMFGTDWIMLARVKDHKEFLQTFRDAFKDRFGSDNCRKFMGGNAVRFLGLGRDQRTRERLVQFYAENSIERPKWMRLIDG